MKKSSIEIVNAIYEKLMQVDILVNEFESKKTSAVDNWFVWLKESEELLKRFNYTECAELASFRSSILHENSIPDLGRTTKRKRTFSKALATFQPAQIVLLKIYKPLEEKIETVRNLIRQILVPAKEAGMIQYDPSVDFTQYLESLLRQFQAQEQLAPSINSAIASIGKYDVLRILAEEIQFE